MTRLFTGLLLSTVLALSTFASKVYAEVFQVDDIRIEGLQRVSAGTVFAALPISVGDLIDDPFGWAMAPAPRRVLTSMATNPEEQLHFHGNA